MHCKSLWIKVYAKCINVIYVLLWIKYLLKYFYCENSFHFIQILKTSQHFRNSGCSNTALHSANSITDH